MSELTPERIRDAAEVLEILASRFNIPVPGLAVFSAHTLRGDADQLERKQAAESKREKRVEVIAQEAYHSYAPEWMSVWPPTTAEYWRNVARALLDRYPALADEAES